MEQKTRFWSFPLVFAQTFEKFYKVQTVPIPSNLNLKNFIHTRTHKNVQYGRSFIKTHNFIWKFSIGKNSLLAKPKENFCNSSWQMSTKGNVTKNLKNNKIEWEKKSFVQFNLCSSFCDSKCKFKFNKLNF